MGSMEQLNDCMCHDHVKCCNTFVPSAGQWSWNGPNICANCKHDKACHEKKAAQERHFQLPNQ